MSKTTHRKLSSGDTDRPLIQPLPPELVIERFTPTKTYKLPLIIHNNDKVLRNVMLQPQPSECFSVVLPKKMTVAPGLSVTFTVCFTPLEDKDYHHRLDFMTDREAFEVPVRAIGPRAVLNFPSEIHLPVCPVKVSTEKTHQVRNVGNAEAKFRLHTKRPFSVTPSCGTLGVNEFVQVTVTFNPITTGDYQEILQLHYHTGEDVYILLHGACKELDIHLEPNSVHFNKTYISRDSMQRVSLIYKSEIPLKYCWTTWPSLQEEALSFLRGRSALQQHEEEVREQWLLECESDPLASLRLPLLFRALQESRTQAVNYEEYRVTFSHDCMTVEPAEGEISPNVPVTFDIFFKPEEDKLYQQTIYLDITGREDRLPLTISGEGTGPNVEFTFEQVDLMDTLINGTNSFEMELHNRGLIDAPFRLSHPDTTFGRCFSFRPEAGVVPVGAAQIVRFTLCSPNLGTFSEDMLLTVAGQPQPTTVTFRGRVIGPTFHFSVPELNFRDVAFGFPQTRTCCLFQTSSAPVTVSLRVQGDGSGSPSVTAAQQAFQAHRKNWEGGAGPVEFTATPAAVSVPHLSGVDIQVTLCSNTVRTYSLGLVVDVEGVGEVITLPISARCVVPDVVVETPVLDFHKCFLNHPYERRVRLTNASALPACYGVLDQDDEESPSLQFGSPAPRGLIPPHSSEEFPVSMLAKVVGKHRHTLRIAVFGSVQPPLEVEVSCIGQAPIVHVLSPRLDFGSIPVLTDVTRVLHLSNQSPVPACFTASMSRGGSVWRVEPSEGEVPPESELELRVVAHLKDTLHFKAGLQVSIQDGKTHTVPLSATGRGTTIVSDRTFAPALDLGSYLSHQLCQYHFKLTNLGKRMHRLYWRPDGFSLSGKTRKKVLPPIRAATKKDDPGRGSSPSSAGEEPVFSLRPCRVELAPGCSADMVLTGFSDSPKVVRERLVCSAIVGRQGCSETIMTVDITCRFVAPMISISPKQLQFSMEKFPGQSLTAVHEKLILENVSSLSLSMELSVIEPFSLCEAPGGHNPASTKSVVLGDGKQAELWVCFNPDYCQDRVSRVVDKVLDICYHGHPQRDAVKLHAEVHFPNLHFSATTVDFGSVLNCTGTRETITITNCSLLPVSYRWAFLEDQRRRPAREELMQVQEDPESQRSSGRRSRGLPGLSGSAGEEQISPVGVEEVFDILPIYGRLLPGEQQQVTFSFYGYVNIRKEAVALCYVEEGPTYEVQLRGEASVMSYSLDRTHLDFGLLLFDRVGVTEVTLRNTGKLGFTFSILHPQREDEEAGGQRKDEEQDIRPGRPVVVPNTGHVDPGEERRLRVLFLPGVPRAFRKLFQVQVAFLPPQDVMLTGEGVFPRISLDLPRNLPEESYSDVVQQARAAVEAHPLREELMNGGGGVGGAGDYADKRDELLHAEMERTLVERNALAVTGSLLELRDLQGSSRKWHKLSQFLLPEYVLDFGFVIPGKVVSHTVNVTNTGPVAVSFHANNKPLAGTGFSAEVEKVKMPPCGETHTFTVTFDAQKADLTGDTSLVMPIQVSGGPTVQVRLCATITVPAVTVSMDTLQFDTLQCGMCQMRTVQLSNHESVPCRWSIVEHEKSPKKNQPLPPAVFKAIPSSGSLSPGERINVQIKFSPAEECLYSRQLAVRVAYSSQQVMVTVQGQGHEPRLEFCPAELELGPCLPSTPEVQAEVTVRNPCSFPVEFYSLEKDTQYLEEEKILRLMEGYDKKDTLLLPPRAPGESLPTELLDYYKEHHVQPKDDAGQKVEEEETLCQSGDPAADGGVEETPSGAMKPAELLVWEMSQDGGAMRDLKMTPVSMAIARHMCVDLSPEGLAARNRRGIAVIVYGAPQTGLSSPAATLAHHYSASRLSVDAVVTEMRPGDDLLPEQPLVGLLAERFQQGDCHHGIVIEGLDSTHTQSVAGTLQVILKALGDRKHIYVVDLSDSYSELKARERAQRETEEALQKEKAEREEQWLQELDEEAYGALSEEQKQRVITRHREKFQQHKLSELKRPEKEEKTQPDETSRPLEDSKKSKKGRKGDFPLRPNEAHGPHGQGTDSNGTPTLSSRNSRLLSRLAVHTPEDASPCVADRSHVKTEEAKEPDLVSPEPADKQEGETQPVVDELESQFNEYERSRQQVEHVLRHWDRTQGSLLVPLPAEDAPVLEDTTVRRQDAIPHIVLNVAGNDSPSANELLEGDSLPPPQKVLDELGLGPSGPPVPPPTTFSVVPFPKNRQQPSHQLTCSCFTFLVPPGQEEQEENKGTSVVKVGGGSRARSRMVVSKRHSRSASSRPVSTTPEPQRNQSLTTFRWVVPANGEVTLKIWFYSDSPGTWEQKFNFELLGTQRPYQLVCRGVCTYPSISRDYRTLFALTEKAPRMEEGLQKAYVVTPGHFEFGPLLCGKTRDRYKENRYPENSQRLLIHNSSGLEVEVGFSFRHDTRAATYLLDPPTMTLRPDQKQELTVWAFPTKLGQVRDSVVCHIKDNPEPVVIELSCWGVRPELELDTKHLNFNRTLLQREDSRSLTLHNKTALPVSWRLRGVEELGPDFSVTEDQGVVPPRSSSLLSVYFRARRQKRVRETLRLEVSDVENILGIEHTENIQVTAEAYDIALEITPDNFLNFETIKVFEEAELCLQMKNQGKYTIAYMFMLQQTEPTQPDLGSVFTVTPQSGSLIPQKRQMVQISCRPKAEVSIREQPVLLCQVIEPSLGTGGETLATITVKVSVKAVFSRYKISPACDLNFGPLVLGCKKSQSFTIENNGVFETRFSISRMISDSDDLSRRKAPGRKMPQETHLEKVQGANRGRRDSAQTEAMVAPLHPPVQQRLNTGVFVVSPCTVTVQPGSHQEVMVDCVADQLGNWNQALLIDVADRNPSDHPGGVPYRLLAEVCRPGVVTDVTSIFEEHHLCQNSSLLSSEQFSNAEGIYVQEENKFIFNKVLVGQTARARLKLTNSSKVPCVLSLAVRYVSSKTSCKVFDLAATTLSIPGLTHSFAVVTFTPQAAQLYSAVFEASVELPSKSSTTPTLKSKLLEVNLTGQGNLPSVRVLSPALRTSRGNPVLRFTHVHVGRRRSRKLVLLNNGTVPAQVQIDMLDIHRVFTLKAAPGNTHSSVHSTHIEGSDGSERQLVHKATLALDVDERVTFEVSFCSDEPLSVEAKMSLRVEHNQHANTVIQVAGSSYREMVSLDNISEPLDQDRKKEMDQDDEGGNYELLDFGDCHVGRSYQESFTMTNHSSSQPVRFEWPAVGSHLVFSPQVGHLHAGCSKEVTVTFCSSQPLTLTSQPTGCRVSVVEFEQPLDEVFDWDDRQRTALWQRSGAAQQPVNNQAEPEPSCSVVVDSQWELKLRVSAVCDYVKFSCSTDDVQFKDTMLYQSRLHQLRVENHGAVKLVFSWRVLMDPMSNAAGADEVLPPLPGRRSAGLLNGSSPASTMGDRDPPPVSIEPSVGVVAPGATQNFDVRFSPLEVGQFQGRLTCSIPNLADEDPAPSISVRGRSLLPICHFDLEDSDYIARRSPEFRVPVDPQTRVLEFTSVGSSDPSTRCFSVLNPTTRTYSFRWSCADGGPFRCLTPHGTILPGKKVEVCFRYEPKQPEAVESSWSFVIESPSLSIPFLCVGSTREPLVYLDRPYLDFGELLVSYGVEKSVELVNGEDEVFHFSVIPGSLLCHDQQSSIIVQPMTGTVAPRDRLPLSVSFMPCRDGPVSFRPAVRVRRKAEPLALVVTAACFSMSATVHVEETEGGLRELNDRDTLDFGEVGISEQSTIHLLVSNLARFKSAVTLDLTGPGELLQHLQVKPQADTVEVGEQLRASLFFSPRSVYNLQDVRLSIKIKHGPTFTFAIEGRAAALSLDFSFTKYDFGKHFLSRPGTAPASETLVISNKGRRNISVQCLFTNTPRLEIDFQPDVLSPGDAMQVPIHFYPREAGRVHEKLTFVLNGCVRKRVEVLGHGVEAKLEVETPEQTRVKLGTLMVGQKVKKQVVVVNRSPLDLHFTLLLNNNTPLDPRDLSISPSGELSLKASGGSVRVTVQFSPRHRVPSFSATLQAECGGLLLHLSTIQGCCQGVEVRLDRDHLAFGAVVQRCPVRKRIIVVNAGDIQARFAWRTEMFPRELSVAPAKGVIGAGAEIPFEVTFAPVELSDDARYENLCCYVEGSASPLSLTVTGSCVTASTNEVLSFVCPVRGSHTQTLPVSNPTSQRCCIRPVMDGKEWSTSAVVHLEPLQTRTLEITYRPLNMTSDTASHQGSVFLSFPDGTAARYFFQGTAEPPKPEDTIVHKLPAKTQHTELLAVNNWLSKQQRFRVLMEILKPDKPDATVSLKGPQYIIVPALTSRGYELSFFAYREGQYNVKVTFRNEASGEYLFYLLTFKTTPPGVLSTIKLVAAVRQMVSAAVDVENPLTTAACLAVDCKSTDISAPAQYTVTAQSKGSLSFKYQPLHAGETTARLTLFSNDLGHFHYDLLLTALPPLPEKTVHFRTTLGSSESRLVKFSSHAHKTKYLCKTDSPDFTAEMARSQPGSEEGVDVCFEPHQVGEVRAQLSLSSTIGGEYVFPLHGVCLGPTAQGPFTVKDGSTVAIPFKNVFLQTATFSFQVDNPCFSVQETSSIASKASHNVLVSFTVSPRDSPRDSPRNSPGPWLAKLTVSRLSEGVKEPDTWEFYLNGVLRSA